MASESMKPNETEQLKHIDQEIREMISALTNRLANLQHVHRAAGGSQKDDEEHGFSIITLAGTNVGATMRAELDSDDNTKAGPDEEAEQQPLTTYVNSNFQALNNSIMLGGEYSTNDPGVHMEISDFTEQQPKFKHGKKGKKKENMKEKEKASSKSDDDHSD